MNSVDNFLVLVKVADELNQIANNANFWSRARIAKKAADLRDILRDIHDPKPQENGEDE